MKGSIRILFGAILAAVLTASSCSSSKNFERGYRRAWKKIVNSQAWKDALYSGQPELADNSGVFRPITSNPGENPLLTNKGEGIDEAFLEHFQSLVFRAYFRTITEAEKADSGIYEAYKKLLESRALKENRDDPAFKQELQLAKNRYLAHRRMLDGLRSWKAFNKFGSDDLDFFLAEHLPQAYAMSRQGKSDEYILRFLVYRLADLYHFEE